MKTDKARNNIENKLRATLFYLTGDEELAKREITIELLLSIREYLNNSSFTEDRYRTLFPKAYAYDTTHHKVKDDHKEVILDKSGKRESYYDNDGFEYLISQKGQVYSLEGYRLLEGTEDILMDPHWILGDRYLPIPLENLPEFCNVLMGTNKEVCFNSPENTKVAGYRIKCSKLAGSYVEISQGRYHYYYMNEVDHFFTFWICKYLAKPKGDSREGGITLLWEQDVPEWIKQKYEITDNQ